MIFWSSAFLIGFLGSFHCAVMCGPIVLAGSGTRRFNASFLIKQIVYNIGRICTYVVIGLFIGFLGKGFYLSGIQQFTSIISGVLLIVFYFGPKVFGSSFFINQIISRLSSFLKRSIAPHIKSSSIASRFLTGMINGLLPCGLVYVAAAGAITGGNTYNGALYMFFFGLGTVPMMLAVGSAAKILSFSYRSKINKAIPALVVSIAVLMIVRGMDLGIKYVSPKISVENHSSTIPTCGVLGE